MFLEILVMVYTILLISHRIAFGAGNALCLAVLRLRCAMDSRVSGRY
jgi:hypothetical protein